MRTISARDAKNGFGRLMDLARAEPVTIEKHGRAVVVVLAIEEYERLKETREHNTGEGAISGASAKDKSKFE